MQRRFRIGFVSPWNSDDVKAWSGTPFFMRRAIEERGHEVIPIGPLQAPNHFAHTALRKTCRLMGRHYDMQRHPWVAKAYARQVSERVRGQAIDILISTSTIPLADLKADVPVMVWTDAVFSAMVDFYPGNWSRLWSVSRRQGEALETRAIRRIDFNIFSSQWAASCAVKLHGADPAKLAVIPLGANLEAVPGTKKWQPQSYPATWTSAGCSSSASTGRARAVLW